MPFRPMAGVFGGAATKDADGGGPTNDPRLTLGTTGGGAKEERGGATNECMDGPILCDLVGLR